ncbi:MAG: DNA helicase RecQ [Bacteroidales bacterium]|nr:DNA helicase RecQ [Bacteroidales bacterium]MBP5682937.1 DNA helicase RecQ [Bacteroidales bacterium]
MNNKEINLTEYLHKFFGFDRFKGEQEAVVKNVLAGRDTFVLMPTGGGKSLCYQLPSLILEGTAIVISPLIALMKNQVDAMRNISTSENIAHFLNSSLSKQQILQVKEDILNGKTKLLYVAPESLTKEENIEFLKQTKISFYAIDEAHCISEWGHDFRPEYRRIRPIIEEIGRSPIIALTATATPKVQHDIQKNLGITDADIFKSSFYRPNLYYEVRPKLDVDKQIIKFIKQNKGKSGIIYCLSRKKVEELAEMLTVNDIKALPYHAGMDSQTRSDNQDKFLMEEVDVIVATIAFGMGIDKPDVRFVIHYDMPKSLEGYYQETGRAGRDGGEGLCIAFYSSNDMKKLEKFMQNKSVSEQEIGRQLLSETIAYAETSMCRSKMLLNYFGENLEEPCGNCDNCRHPQQKFQGKNAIIKALKVIEIIQEKFKTEHVAKVLAGVSDSQVKTYKHHKLDIFGCGEDDGDENFWNAVLRQALVHGFLSKDIENYGTLKITKEGKDFLKKPYDIELTKNHDYESDDDDDEQAVPHSMNGGASDPELFKMLKDLRKKVSKQRNVPPFVIFQDPSLEDMAVQYPITIDELKQIVGVGQGKAQKFGKEFVELIKRYVQEKEIERPQDMIVKSVVSKSGNKVYIIQSIDRKIDLEDICESKQIEMDELLSEIESIINSGTKLNLDYFIDRVIDDERQEEAYDYFDHAETESIEEAMNELGEDDWTEEELRLMRIKYISEKGH